MNLYLTDRQVAFLEYLLVDIEAGSKISLGGNKVKANKAARKLANKILNKIALESDSEFNALPFWYDDFFEDVVKSNVVKIIPPEPQELGTVRTINGLTYVLASSGEHGDSEPWYSAELMEWFSWDQIHDKNS